MSAVQSSSGITAGRAGAGEPSLALQLLGENQLAGQIDVRGIAQGVSDLAQVNPLGAVQVLEQLKTVLAPLDLARLTSDLTGIVGAVGGLFGQIVDGPVRGLTDGLTNGLGGVVGGAVETLTRTTAALSLDLSRGLDATIVAGLGATRSLEADGGQGLRSGFMGGVDVVADRSFGSVVLPGHRLTVTAGGSVDVVRLKVGSTTGVEMIKAVGPDAATWGLDAQGRFVRAEAVLTDLERSRVETRAQGAADRGVEGEHGGPIIGQRLVKDQGLDSLAPQIGGLDSTAYKTLENEMGDWVEAGAEVRVTVDLIGGGDKPVRVRVAYEVLSAADGDVVYENNVIFRNAAGQTFEQMPSSMLDG
ncbi:hypothetical protein [Brevundimonas sp.]|uniref:hypothetical protein n=1 Tax=Brevundimonas sp. TaxID=1871086 RepID=UPI003D0B3C52